MATVYPHTLNIILKRIKNIINQEDYERAVQEIDKTIDRPFDQLYFADTLVQMVRDRLEFSMLALLMETPNAALNSLTEIRKEIDRIFVRELLLANRLLKEHADIGTLQQLPELVRFEIYKDIYGSL